MLHPAIFLPGKKGLLLLAERSHFPSHHEDLVYLQGRFTKHLRCETYEFTDLAGDTISARLDDDENWSHIRRDEAVEIMAKVNTKRKMSELDVQVARPMK